MKIALIGMMGSGKTSIGQILAARMGIDCIDLDTHVAKITQMSIEKIFKDFGEDYFRRIEQDALETLASDDHDIILCCGGGVVLLKKNRTILERVFLTIWLDVPKAELERRLSMQRDSRPLISSNDWRTQLQTIYRQRLKKYQETAKIRYVWKVGCSPVESAIAIENLISAWTESMAPQE
jgi:shikimate kinase